MNQSIGFSRNNASRLLVACLLGFLFAIFLPLATMAQEHILEILEDELSLQPDTENDNRISTTITIRNNGGAVTGLSFRAISKASDGTAAEHRVTTVSEDDASIAGYSVAQFEIEFPDTTLSETLEGYLIVEAVEDVVAATVPFTIKYVDDTERKVLGAFDVDANGIVWLGFWSAIVSLFIIVIASSLVGQDDPKRIFQGRIELVADWKESWASTLTVFAGTLSTLVTASIFPEEPKILTKTAFQTLQIFFPILVFIAAFAVSAISNAFSKPLPGDNDKKTSPVLPLVLGSPLVLAAFIGELATLIVLFEELQIAEHLSRNTATLTQVLFVLVMALGFLYVVFGVTKTVGKAAMPKPDTKGRMKTPRAYLP